VKHQVSKNVTASNSSISSDLINQRNKSSSQILIKSRDDIKEAKKDVKLSSISSIDEKLTISRQFSDKVDNRYGEE